MFTRLRLAGVVSLLVCASATVSFAQAPDSTTGPVRYGHRPGRGSIGAQTGSSLIVSGQDYSEGAQPRLSFAGSFGYVISPKWQWRVDPYYTWNAYKPLAPLPLHDPGFPDQTTKGHVITQIAGANVQLQRTGGKGNWIWHAGLGPAIYRVLVEDYRTEIKDPVSHYVHRGTYVGATAEYGIERFMKSLPNTSLEWTIAYQTAFAKSDGRFPSGFNGTPGAIELRFGGHYYYDFKAPKKPAGIPRRAH